MAMPKPQMRVSHKNRTLDDWIRYYRTGFTLPELPSIKDFLDSYLIEKAGEDNRVVELRVQALNYLLLERTLK